MLDTNIVIYVIKRRPIDVMEIFNRHVGQMCVSSITLAELLHANCCEVPKIPITQPPQPHAEHQADEGEDCQGLAEHGWYDCTPIGQ